MIMIGWVGGWVGNNIMTRARLDYRLRCPERGQVFSPLFFWMMFERVVFCMAWRCIYPYSLEYVAED